MKLLAGMMSALLCVLTAAGLYLIQVERKAIAFEEQATVTLKVLGEDVPARVDAQLTVLTSNLNARLDDAIGKADSRIGESLAIARKTETDATSQIAGVRADVKELVAAADNRAAAIQAEVQPLIGTYAALPDRVGAQLMPYWECTRQLPDGSRTGNAACWPSEITGTMGAARTFMGQTAAASRTFEQRFPELLQLGGHMMLTADATETDVKTATGVVADFSKRVGTKPHWYDRIIGLAPTTIRAWEAVK